MKNLFFKTNGPATAGLIGALLLLAGCDRNEVKVYEVAKESPPAALPTAMPTGQPDAAAPAQPALRWKTPDGWTEVKPGEMRLASFKVSKDGKQVDVSIVPLPGVAGGDTPNVNRWRGQVGLEAVTAEEITKSAENVDAGSQPAALYDLAGTNPATGGAVRIIAAIQHRDDMAWFFKMTGDDQLVESQKPAFVEFLKSLNFTAGQATASETMPTELPAGHPPMDGANVLTPNANTTVIGGVDSKGSDKPNWSVPAGWTEISGGQFLVAKFTIAGEGAAKEAVNVSSAAGEGGGLAGNVNRWRGQLRLTPIAEILTTPIEVAGGKGQLVDFSGTNAQNGQPARLIGAIVPQGGQTWFFKLMGDPRVVESQKEAFTKFVQGVKY